MMFIEKNDLEYKSIETAKRNEFQDDLQDESVEPADSDDIFNEHDNFNSSEINNDHNSMESKGKESSLITTDEDAPEEIRNWSHKAILNLIGLYKKFLPEFKNTTIRKDIVWRKISRQLGEENFKFTSKQVENKWKNLRKQYIAKKDNMGDKSSGAKFLSFHYFEEMNDIYALTPEVEPVAIASSSKSDQNPSQDDRRQKKRKTSNSANLLAWTKEMLEESKKQEDGRERRHQENLKIQNKALETYTNMMGKLLDKL